MFWKRSAVFGVLLFIATSTGCSTKPTGSLIYESKERQELMVSSKDLQGLSMTGGDISDPHYLLASGLSKWNQHSYLEAGNLLLNAYKAGKAKGFQWHINAKAALLTTALRGYCIAGAFEQARYTSDFISKEISTEEQSFLSQESKTLLYLTSMHSDHPLFKAEVPARMRIANFIH